MSAPSVPDPDELRRIIRAAGPGNQAVRSAALRAAVALDETRAENERLRAKLDAIRALCDEYVQRWVYDDADAIARSVIIILDDEAPR